MGNQNEPCACSMLVAAKTMKDDFEFNIPSNAVSISIESNREYPMFTSVKYKMDLSGLGEFEREESTEYNSEVSCQIAEVLGLNPELATFFSIGGGREDVLMARIETAVSIEQFEQILTLLKGETK